MKPNRRSGWRETAGWREFSGVDVLVILITVWVWARDNVWTSIDSFGGGIRALAIHPQSPITSNAGKGGGAFRCAALCNNVGTPHTFSEASACGSQDRHFGA